MYASDYTAAGLDPATLSLQDLFNKNSAYKGFGAPKDLSTRCEPLIAWPQEYSCVHSR
jgi:hypothetical protein